jgi:hypothetical protein
MLEEYRSDDHRVKASSEVRTLAGCQRGDLATGSRARWPCSGSRTRVTLARRHLAPDANPARMALFDLSSSWLEGTHCPLGARGYSRDGKKGNIQIEYGLLTDPRGRPVAICVLDGNTADPVAFPEIASVVRDA